METQGRLKTSPALATITTTAGRDWQDIASGDIAAMHYTGWLYDESVSRRSRQRKMAARDRNQVC